MFTPKAGLFGSAFFAVAFNYLIYLNSKLLPYSLSEICLPREKRPFRFLMGYSQSKSLIPLHKNQNFQKFFIFFPHNNLAQIPRSEQGRFSFQTRR